MVQSKTTKYVYIQILYMNDSNIKVGKLSYIPVKDIIPNPNNPRRLFDEKPMDVLKQSIKEVGILNPLLVYQRKKDDQLVILDGERRWICAKALGIKEVPANIIEEPEPLENIIRMFNIHNIREPWELMPTALKLEVIMRTKHITSDRILAELTSLSKSTVAQCKILLSYPKKYQDLMLSITPENRIKPNFFIELCLVLNLIGKNLPGISSKFDRDEITQIFLWKYTNGVFTDVVGFRKVARLIRSVKKGVPKREVEAKIYTFLSEKQSKLEEVIQTSEEISERLGLKKSFDKMSLKLENMNIKTAYKDKEFLDSLLSLKRIVDKTIEKIQKGRE